MFELCVNEMGNRPTKAGAKCVAVGLGELREFLLSGHLNSSRAGGAGGDWGAHEGIGRAEGKSEGDGGELHLAKGLKGL